MQAVRERGAEQERLHARQAARPLQGLRAELHRHAATGVPALTSAGWAARDAAAGQGDRHPALPQRPVTAKLLGVSTPSVMAWIERFAKDHAPKPEPEGRALVVELDEMGHYLKNVWPAPSASGFGRSELNSLRQRIRPVGSALAKMEIRALRS